MKVPNYKILAPSIEHSLRHIVIDIQSTTTYRHHAITIYRRAIIEPDESTRMGIRDSAAHRRERSNNSRR